MALQIHWNDYFRVLIPSWPLNQRWPLYTICPIFAILDLDAKMQFSQKLSNLELWCLLTTYRKLCKLNWAFQKTNYWIPAIQDG